MLSFRHTAYCQDYRELVRSYQHYLIVQGSLSLDGINGWINYILAIRTGFSSHGEDVLCALRYRSNYQSIWVPRSELEIRDKARLSNFLQKGYPTITKEFSSSPALPLRAELFPAVDRAFMWYDHVSRTGFGCGHSSDSIRKRFHDNLYAGSAVVAPIQVNTKLYCFSTASPIYQRNISAFNALSYTVGKDHPISTIMPKNASTVMFLVAWKNSTYERYTWENLLFVPGGIEALFDFMTVEMRHSLSRSSVLLRNTQLLAFPSETMLREELTALRTLEMFFGSDRSILPILVEPFSALIFALTHKSPSTLQGLSKDDRRLVGTSSYDSAIQPGPSSFLVQLPKFAATVPAADATPRGIADQQCSPSSDVTNNVQSMSIRLLVAEYVALCIRYKTRCFAESFRKTIDVASEKDDSTKNDLLCNSNSLVLRFLHTRSLNVPPSYSKELVKAGDLLRVKEEASDAEGQEMQDLPSKDTALELPYYQPFERPILVIASSPDAHALVADLSAVCPGAFSSLLTGGRIMVSLGASFLSSVSGGSSGDTSSCEAPILNADVVILTLRDVENCSDLLKHILWDSILVMDNSLFTADISHLDMLSCFQSERRLVITADTGLPAASFCARACSFLLGTPVNKVLEALEKASTAQEHALRQNSQVPRPQLIPFSSHTQDTSSPSGVTMHKGLLELYRTLSLDAIYQKIERAFAGLCVRADIDFLQTTRKLLDSCSEGTLPVSLLGDRCFPYFCSLVPRDWCDCRQIDSRIEELSLCLEKCSSASNVVDLFLRSGYFVERDVSSELHLNASANELFGTKADNTGTLGLHGSYLSTTAQDPIALITTAMLNVSPSTCCVHQEDSLAASQHIHRGSCATRLLPTFEDFVQNEVISKYPPSHTTDQIFTDITTTDHLLNDMHRYPLLSSDVFSQIFPGNSSAVIRKQRAFVLQFSPSVSDRVQARLFVDRDNCLRRALFEDSKPALTLAYESSDDQQNISKSNFFIYMAILRYSVAHLLRSLWLQDSPTPTVVVPGDGSTLASAVPVDESNSTDGVDRTVADSMHRRKPSPPGIEAEMNSKSGETDASERQSSFGDYTPQLSASRSAIINLMLTSLCKRCLLENGLISVTFVVPDGVYEPFLRFVTETSALRSKVSLTPIDISKVCMEFEQSHALLTPTNQSSSSSVSNLFAHAAAANALRTRTSHKTSILQDYCSLLLDSLKSGCDFNVLRDSDAYILHTASSYYARKFRNRTVEPDLSSLDLQTFESQEKLIGKLSKQSFVIVHPFVSSRMSDFIVSDLWSAGMSYPTSNGLSPDVYQFVGLHTIEEQLLIYKHKAAHILAKEMELFSSFASSRFGRANMCTAPFGEGLTKGKRSVPHEKTRRQGRIKDGSSLRTKGCDANVYPESTVPRLFGLLSEIYQEFIYLNNLYTFSDVGGQFHRHLANQSNTCTDSGHESTYASYFKNAFTRQTINCYLDCDLLIQASLHTIFDNVQSNMSTYISSMRKSREFSLADDTPLETLGLCKLRLSVEDQKSRNLSVLLPGSGASRQAPKGSCIFENCTYFNYLTQGIYDYFKNDEAIDLQSAPNETVFDSEKVRATLSARDLVDDAFQTVMAFSTPPSALDGSYADGQADQSSTSDASPAYHMPSPAYSAHILQISTNIVTTNALQSLQIRVRKPLRREAPSPHEAIFNYLSAITELSTAGESSFSYFMPFEKRVFALLHPHPLPGSAAITEPTRITSLSSGDDTASVQQLTGLPVCLRCYCGIPVENADPIEQFPSYGSLIQQLDLCTLYGSLIDKGAREPVTYLCSVCLRLFSLHYSDESFSKVLISFGEQGKGSDVQQLPGGAITTLLKGHQEMDSIDTAHDSAHHSVCEYSLDAIDCTEASGVALQIMSPIVAAPPLPAADRVSLAALRGAGGSDYAGAATMNLSCISYPGALLHEPLLVRQPHIRISNADLAILHSVIFENCSVPSNGTPTYRKSRVCARFFCCASLLSVDKPFVYANELSRPSLHQNLCVGERKWTQFMMDYFVFGHTFTVPLGSLPADTEGADDVSGLQSDFSLMYFTHILSRGLSLDRKTFAQRYAVLHSKYSDVSMHYASLFGVPMGMFATSRLLCDVFRLNADFSAKELERNDLPVSVLLSSIYKYSLAQGCMSLGNIKECTPLRALLYDNLLINRFYSYLLITILSAPALFSDTQASASGAHYNIGWLEEAEFTLRHNHQYASYYNHLCYRGSLFYGASLLLSYIDAHPDKLFNVSFLNAARGYRDASWSESLLSMPLFYSRNIIADSYLSFLFLTRIFWQPGTTLAIDFDAFSREKHLLRSLAGVLSALLARNVKLQSVFALSDLPTSQQLSQMSYCHRCQRYRLRNMSLLTPWSFVKLHGNEACLGLRKLLDSYVATMDQEKLRLLLSVRFKWLYMLARSLMGDFPCRLQHGFENSAFLQDLVDYDDVLGLPDSESITEHPVKCVTKAPRDMAIKLETVINELQRRRTQEATATSCASEPPNILKQPCVGGGMDLIHHVEGTYNCIPPMLSERAPDFFVQGILPVQNATTRSGNITSRIMPFPNEGPTLHNLPAYHGMPIQVSMPLLPGIPFAGMPTFYETGMYPAPLPSNMPVYNNVPTYSGQPVSNQHGNVSVATYGNLPAAQQLANGVKFENMPPANNTPLTLAKASIIEASRVANSMLDTLSLNNASLLSNSQQNASFSSKGAANPSPTATKPKGTKRGPKKQRKGAACIDTGVTMSAHSSLMLPTTTNFANITPPIPSKLLGQQTDPQVFFPAGKTPGQQLVAQPLDLSLRSTGPMLANTPGPSIFKDSSLQSDMNFGVFSSSVTSRQPNINIFNDNAQIRQTPRLMKPSPLSGQLPLGEPLAPAGTHAPLQKNCSNNRPRTNTHQLTLSDAISSVFVNIISHIKELTQAYNLSKTDTISDSKKLVFAINAKFFVSYLTRSYGNNSHYLLYTPDIRFLTTEESLCGLIGYNLRPMALENYEFICTSAKTADVGTLQQHAYMVSNEQDFPMSSRYMPAGILPLARNNLLQDFLPDPDLVSRSNSFFAKTLYEFDTFMVRRALLQLTVMGSHGEIYLASFAQDTVTGSWMNADYVVNTLKKADGRSELVYAVDMAIEYPATTIFRGLVAENPLTKPAAYLQNLIFSFEKIIPESRRRIIIDKLLRYGITTGPTPMEVAEPTYDKILLDNIGLPGCNIFLSIFLLVKIIVYLGYRNEDYPASLKGLFSKQKPVESVRQLENLKFLTGKYKESRFFYDVVSVYINEEISSQRSANIRFGIEYAFNPLATSNYATNNLDYTDPLLTLARRSGSQNQTPTESALMRRNSDGLLNTSRDSTTPIHAAPQASFRPPAEASGRFSTDPHQQPNPKICTNMIKMIIDIRTTVNFNPVLLETHKYRIHPDLADFITPEIQSDIIRMVLFNLSYIVMHEQIIDYTERLFYSYVCHNKMKYFLTAMGSSPMSSVFLARRIDPYAISNPNEHFFIQECGLTALREAWIYAAWLKLDFLEFFGCDDAILQRLVSENRVSPAACSLVYDLYLEISNIWSKSHDVRFIQSVLKHGVHRSFAGIFEDPEYGFRSSIFSAHDMRQFFNDLSNDVDCQLDRSHLIKMFPSSNGQEQHPTQRNVTEKFFIAFGDINYARPLFKQQELDAFELWNQRLRVYPNETIVSFAITKLVNSFASIKASADQNRMHAKDALKMRFTLLTDACRVERALSCDPACTTVLDKPTWIYIKKVVEDRRAWPLELQLIDKQNNLTQHQSQPLSRVFLSGSGPTSSAGSSLMPTTQGFNSFGNKSSNTLFRPLKSINIFTNDNFTAQTALPTQGYTNYGVPFAGTQLSFGSGAQNSLISMPQERDAFTEQKAGISSSLQAPDIGRQMTGTYINQQGVPQQDIRTFRAAGAFSGSTDGRTSGVDTVLPPRQFVIAQAPMGQVVRYPTGAQPTMQQPLMRGYSQGSVVTAPRVNGFSVPYGVNAGAQLYPQPAIPVQQQSWVYDPGHLQPQVTDVQARQPNVVQFASAPIPYGAPMQQYPSGQQIQRYPMDVVRPLPPDMGVMQMKPSIGAPIPQKAMPWIPQRPVLTMVQPTVPPTQLNDQYNSSMQPPSGAYCIPAVDYKSLNFVNDLSISLYREPMDSLLRIIDRGLSNIPLEMRTNQHYIEKYLFDMANRQIPKYGQTFMKLLSFFTRDMPLDHETVKCSYAAIDKEVVTISGMGTNRGSLYDLIPQLIKTSSPDIAGVLYNLSERFAVNTIEEAYIYAFDTREKIVDNRPLDRSVFQFIRELLGNLTKLGGYRGPNLKLKQKHFFSVFISSLSH